MKRRIIVFGLLFLYPFFLLTQPDDVLRVEAVGKSSQDITPKSKARAMALRAATLEGYRKIAEKAGLVKKNRIGDSDYKEAKVFLKGAIVVSQSYITDHEVEIVMEIPVSRLTKNVAEFKANTADKKRAQLKKEIDSLEKKINLLKSELEALKKKLEKIE